MTFFTSNYLDGNAAAGELSKIFAIDLRPPRDSVRTAVQGSVLLKRTYTCKAPASSLGAPFASTYSCAL
jgi:hypothetical protein